MCRVTELTLHTHFFSFLFSRMCFTGDTSVFEGCVPLKIQKITINPVRENLYFARNPGHMYLFKEYIFIL